MTLHTLQGGALRDVAQLFKFEGGRLRKVSALYRMTGGNLRLVASYADMPMVGDPTAVMTINASPSDVYADGQSRSAQRLVTEPVSLTPSGGVAPYSYAWSINQGANVVQPGMASTAFIRMTYDEAVVATFVCICTDAVGNQATATGTATFTHDKTVPQN